jgi:hypothetical protein
MIRRSDTPRIAEQHREGPRVTDQHNDTVKALIGLLGDAQRRLAAHGDLLWQRTSDWERMQTDPTPQGEYEGVERIQSDLEAEDRAGDAAAARYKHELRTLASRLRNDLGRLVQIDETVVRAQPKKLLGRDMLLAQVAAEGWCVSCWRDDQHLVPIEKRASGPQKGSPYYRDLCRFCGGWKAEHGQEPPLDVLQRRHDGRRMQRTAS